MLKQFLFKFLIVFDFITPNSVLYIIQTFELNSQY